MVPEGAPASLNVFLRDTDNGTNLLVSVSLSGGFGDNVSSAPIFSPDGRWLMFCSLARNLLASGLPAYGNGSFIAWDLINGQTILVNWQTSSPFATV